MAGKEDFAPREFQQLAQYWFRANLMHDYLHTMREACGRNLRSLSTREWWKFSAYLDYWLSALFVVVVEGFNKLKIKDKNVQVLFNANIASLKQHRHNTYHFVVSGDSGSGAPSPQAIYEQLNWAEKLHEALGDHLKRIADEGTDKAAYKLKFKGR